VANHNQNGILRGALSFDADMSERDSFVREFSVGRGPYFSVELTAFPSVILGRIVASVSSWNRSAESR